MTETKEPVSKYFLKTIRFILLPVFANQEPSFSPDLSDDARLVGEVCGKYDRQLVEEGDKGLIDGCGSGGACLSLASNRSGLLVFMKQQQYLFVLERRSSLTRFPLSPLSRELHTGDIVFQELEASLRQPAVTPDFQLMIRETSNVNPGPPERKKRVSPPFPFTVDDAEDSQRSCSGLI